MFPPLGFGCSGDPRTCQASAAKGEKGETEEKKEKGLDGVQLQLQLPSLLMEEKNESSQIWISPPGKPSFPAKSPILILKPSLPSPYHHGSAPCGWGLRGWDHGHLRVVPQKGFFAQRSAREAHVLLKVPVRQVLLGRVPEGSLDATQADLPRVGLGLQAAR
jgi:hypothetical protein